MNDRPISTYRIAAILATGLSFSAAHSATWSASGTVKTASGTNLSGVAVTVKDSVAALKTTTDNNANFTLGSAMGISPSTLPMDFSVRQAGNQLQIAYPGVGTLGLRLVDLSGTTLWSGSASLQAGYATATLPALDRQGAAILRASIGNEIAVQPLTLLGDKGFTLVSRVSARSLAANPTLVFKKVGYADTTYLLNSASQSGIAVVMRDSTIHIPPQPTTCKLPSGPNSGSGSFTNYWFGQGSWQENGHYALACGYHGYEPSGQGSDKIDNIANPQYFVAIPGNSSSDFNTNGMCGACVELTGQNGTKIVATVTDECPEDINQPCKNNHSGHLDISYPAFSKLGFSVGNPSGTTWKYVKCPVTGNVVIRIKPGNATQLYVENTILPIKDILISGSGSTHLTYGAWDLGTRAAGSTITIKDYSDRTITYKVPASLAADQNQDIGLQFPACN